MQPKEVVKSVFYGAYTCLIALICWIASQGLSELRGVRTEVSDLNLKMVAVISNQDFLKEANTRQDVELKSLDDRLRAVEIKR